MYDKFMQESTKANYLDKSSNMLGGIEKFLQKLIVVVFQLI